VEVREIHMPKLDGLSGGTDDYDENEENAQDHNGLNEDGVNVEILESEVPNRDYAEYLTSCIKRTVKEEDSLVRQIQNTAFSKDSTHPLNLGILAPTSEGKTYPVTETLQYWDSKDIWYIASMSPRYLIRMYGKRIDESGDPLEIKEGELKRAIATAKADREGEKRYRIKKKQQGLQDLDKTGQKVIQIEPDIPLEDVRCTDDTLERLEKELEELYEKARTVINLQGKLLVFLEPPYPDTWNIIKPILSHDKFIMEHPYVDKVDGSIHSIRVVTMGWPAVIMCSAKNESENDYWSEIQSRFIISSPNMIPEKYKAGNILIGMRAGAPHCVWQKEVISDHQVEVARECVKYLFNRIKKLSEDKVEEKRSLTYIPFSDILSKALPSGKGTDNRINNRIYSFLKMVVISRSQLRKKIVVDNETLIVAELEDLHEALHIAQNNIGIPTFKLEVFREIFIPSWRQLERMEAVIQRDIEDAEALPDSSIKDQSISEAKRRTVKHVVDGELVLVLTAKQLTDNFMKIKKRAITTQNMTSTYLAEYVKSGLLDEVELDGRRTKGYFPIVDLEIYNGKSEYAVKSGWSNFQVPYLERLNSITKHSNIMNTGNKEIDKHWIYNDLMNIISNTEYMENSKFEIYDEDNNRICVHKLIREYENDTKGYLKDFFVQAEYVNDEMEYDDVAFQCAEFHSDYSDYGPEVTEV
jgi:hypothetical protein